MDDFRSKAGKKAAIVAIVANCFLTAFNIAIGIMSGSYALISEGAHTLSDVATSVIAFVGFKIGQKPADDEHPIGHGRAEAIGGLIIVLFLGSFGYLIPIPITYPLISEVSRSAKYSVSIPDTFFLPIYIRLVFLS